MATNRVLQLLRSNTLYVPSGEGANAKTAKQNAKDAVIKLTGRKDGEMLLARYQETGADIKSLLCIYHANPDLNATIAEGAAKHWTFIEDASSSEGSSQALHQEIDAIETAVGLGNDGSYVVPQNTNYIGKETENNSVMTDLVTLDTQVKANADAIDRMDKTASATSGKVLTTVAQANGLVSETQEYLTDIVMADYSKTNNTGAIAATDTLEQAFSKLENAIDAAEVHSNDQSITVTADTTGTNIEVKVDNTTIVKDSDSHAIKGNYTLHQLDSTELAALKDANVKEAYQLQTINGSTAIGNVVKIYKDSALQEVYLGANTDTINTTNGEITKNTVTDPQSMNFAYQLADGTYSLTKIDVSKFLTQSEFSDGLQVSNGVVSVKKDASSGKVRTAAGDNGLVDVLTVSSEGVKVDNIQTAIDYAVQNASSDLAVEAQGDNYITATVDADNNKKINVTADVQSLTATAGTPGVYNTTTGEQTTVPVDGTLSGTANSLADGADIATKVKTYVDGKIAIEAARANAQVKAEEYRATTAETAIDTAVGLGSNHAYSNSGTYIGKALTNTVTSDIAALDTAVGNTLDGVVGSDAINVTDKASKSQTISLILDGTTQGNGNENTGTDNALTITNKGLFLSTTWDCGVY